MIDYFKTYKEKPQYVLSKDSESSTQGFFYWKCKKVYWVSYPFKLFWEKFTELIFFDEFSFQPRKLVYKG